MKNRIQHFLTSKAFGVVGASNHREKFGNKVLRTYLQAKKEVYPVNPHEEVIEGLPVIQNVNALPADVESISIITPPAITEKIVAEAIQKRIKNIWMQPGSESLKAIQLCQRNEINLIAGGPCILVELGFKDE